MTLAQDLRQHVADLLDRVGPDAPTLCEGWTTRDLAAHLVIRDRRPDALPGIGIERFAGYTKKVQDAQAARPYPETVDLVRTGPGYLSIAAIPAVDARMNLAEYAIHAEDVRRAVDADDLPPMPDAGAVATAVWGLLPTMARLVYRKSPVGVVARCAGRDDITLKKATAAGTVVVEGQPVDVLLFASGRADAANVTVQGAPEATAAFTAFRESARGL